MPSYPSVAVSHPLLLMTCANAPLPSPATTFPLQFHLARLCIYSQHASANDEEVRCKYGPPLLYQNFRTVPELRVQTFMVLP